MIIKAIKLLLLLSCGLVINNNAMRRSTAKSNGALAAHKNRRTRYNQGPILRTAIRAAERLLTEKSKSPASLPILTPKSAAREEVHQIVQAHIIAHQQQAATPAPKALFRLPVLKLNLKPAIDAELNRQEALQTLTPAEVEALNNKLAAERFVEKAKHEDFLRKDAEVEASKAAVAQAPAEKSRSSFYLPGSGPYA